MLTVSGVHLLRSTNQAIFSNSSALDRIELALINANFMANRIFLSESRYVQLSPDQIDPDLALPVDSWFGSIKRSFHEEKKRLQSTLYDMEEALDAMHQMLRSTDPVDAYNLYKSVISQHVNGDRHLVFSANFFRDLDLVDEVKSHRARLARLRELNLAGSYVNLVQTYRKAVIDGVVCLGKREGWIRIEVTYERTTLMRTMVMVSEALDPLRIAPPAEPESPRISRRLQLLRRWSYEQVEEVLT